jgi:hypothetical protein
MPPICSCSSTPPKSGAGIGATGKRVCSTRPSRRKNRSSCCAARALKLPDPLKGYQGIEATEDRIQEFLVELLRGTDYVAARPSVAPLSTASETEIASVSKAIEKLMSVELRSGYIPQQLTVRWTPSDELTGVPLDAIVEANEETRVLFRVRVADDTPVTWAELTEFHRSRDHVHAGSRRSRYWCWPKTLPAKSAAIATTCCARSNALTAKSSINSVTIERR